MTGVDSELILRWEDVIPYGKELIGQALEGGNTRGGVSSWNGDMTVKGTQAADSVSAAVEPRDELVQDVVEGIPAMLLEVGDAMIASREVLVAIVGAALRASLSLGTEARSHHLLLRMLFDAFRRSFSGDPLARVRLFH